MKPAALRIVQAAWTMFAIWSAGDAHALDLTGDLRIHDPSRIHREGGRYYAFGTGHDFAPVVSKYSDDLIHWRDGPPVLDGIPAWAEEATPDNAGFMWAPDLFHHNGEYRLYYSLSSWGSQDSVIGMATNTTLDFNDDEYEWVDQGLVIESEVGGPYNAIDAGVFFDETSQRMWLTFGSYWNGVHAVELNSDTGKLRGSRTPPVNLARNPGSAYNAIEAPYLTAHEGRYYLFVNWDSCCQGEDSTYKIMVGRGDSPTGPFTDRFGTPMTEGGGELFLATEGDKIGPGHFGEFVTRGANYFSYHYYDGGDRGASKLGVREFVWTADGWPVVLERLPAGDYNRDGLVTAADYAAWRDTLGESGPMLAADGDRSGFVDARDYVVWAENFGARSSAAPIAVPEPTVTLLALAGAAFAGARRNRLRLGDSIARSAW